VKSRKSSLIFLTGIFFIIVAALLVAPFWKHRGAGSLRTLDNLLPTTVRAAEVNPWTRAFEKVKEERGEPVGKQAKIETPSQLRHYSDSRRFLATQVAEVREHHIENPQDFVDLSALIKAGEMVPLQSVTENYILFGVGGNADKEPFTRYENGKSINLYSEAELRQEYAGIAEARTKFESQLDGFRKDLKNLNKRDRSRRASLLGQIATAERAVKSEDANKALLDRYYGNAERRQQLFAYFTSLQNFGKSLPGRAFDIEDATARRDLRVSMLSSLRPEALKMLNEIAVSYREKFNRPLPITSLVRPDEYQHQLGKTNPNATRIETPPHSTGLAFDILYRFMTAAEQSHVMAHLAQLKDAGRIEVLRENRDHYHVFAFIDGLRPNESVINASLGDAKAPQIQKDTPEKTKSKKSRVVKGSKTRRKR
jgi:hypothetical protein